MPQFLYTLKVTRLEMLSKGPNPEEAAILQAHTEYLNRMLSEKKAILFGRTQMANESTFGIHIFEADDEAAAKLVMENDPVVSGGVMNAKLFPYLVAGMRQI